jgi:hypothetical protein
MNLRIKVVMPLVITFFVLGVLILAAKLFDTAGRVDHIVLMGGNCLFFLVSLIVFRMQYNAMHNSNPNVFIRNVMGGTLIKLFVCLIAVVTYYFLSGSMFNKPAVYLSMIIYIIYLVVEVRTIMKLNKQKNG